MYQTCHCVVTCNRGLNNGLNTESSKVSIKGILTLSWMILLFCEDPVVGSLTSLECALDGFHKLSHMAEEVFGEDVFSSGRKKGKQNKNVSGKKMTLFFHNIRVQLSPLRTCHWIVCQTCLFFVPAVPLSSFSNSYFPFPKHCIIEWAKSKALPPTLPWFWVKCLQGYQTATYNFTVGPPFVHQNITTPKVCLLMFKEVSNLNGSNASHMIFFPRGSEFFPVLFHLHFTRVINLLQLCSFLYHQQH